MGTGKRTSNNSPSEATSLKQPRTEVEIDERRQSAINKLQKHTSSLPFSLWDPDTPTPYLALASTFDAIDSTTKRLEKISLLSSLFHAIMVLSPQDYASVLYLCVNELGPPYMGLTLGLGDAILIDAIANSSGKSSAQVKKDAKRVGDLGDVAQSSKSRQQTLFKPKPLTVPFVFTELMKVARMEGQRSRRDKTGIVTNLLVSCRASESKFIVRSLQGRIRIGASEATVTSAMAVAAVNYSNQRSKEVQQQAEELIKQAYAEINDLGVLGNNLVEFGWKNISKVCNLTVGYPIKPMLAKPTKSVGEVLQRFEDFAFTCEYKYDGERAQVHKTADGKVSIFSRNCEDNTEKYPDLVALFAGNGEGSVIKSSVESFVIDCEVCSWNTATNKVDSFQKLATRARKDVSTGNIEVKVCLFAFDIIFLNGKSLINDSFRNRRELLHESFSERIGEFSFAHYHDCNSVDDISTFLDEAVTANTEGLMVKTLDDNSEYCPARRSYKWLKVKKDYINALGDSLDLVPIGAFYGKGKRSGLFASFIVSIYDSETELFQAVTKVGTGFSDAVFAEFTNTFTNHKLDSPPRSIQLGNIELPDVYFDPENHGIVWEVKAADLSLSPKYPAAQGILSERGIALRFPRFIRVREDKEVTQATDSRALVSFYQSQAGAKEEVDFADDFF
ncbi:hypothetical protein P9112_002996 [Eukaryota sp. TZLM1-RC]